MSAGIVRFFNRSRSQDSARRQSVLDNYYGPTNVTINGLGLGTDPATRCPAGAR